MANRDIHGDIWTNKCPVLGCNESFMSREEYRKHKHKGRQLVVKKCGFRRCPYIYYSKNISEAEQKREWERHMRLKHPIAVEAYA